jgi:hypothetical protein
MRGLCETRDREAVDGSEWMSEMWCAVLGINERPRRRSEANEDKLGQARQDRRRRAANEDIER